MNPGVIWWNQLGNSLRLTEQITDTLRDCRSAVLRVTGDIPWRQDFYEAVDLHRASFSGSRRLIRLDWEDGSEPGEFVLEELCTSRIRAEYWPGQSHAEYLGSKNDILLNEYYVWVTGIHTKTDISKWATFIDQYERTAKDPDNRAVFLLEYDGTDTDLSEVVQIQYAVESYDCRVFCLEAASALSNTNDRDYQAELALCIGAGNPELCFALLESGFVLLNAPVQTARKVISEEISSDGRDFPEMTDQQISSAAWKAAVVLYFPLLEQYRLDFIGRNEGELRRHLPIINSNGDKVTDPYDLELGPLCYITTNHEKAFPGENLVQLGLCRKVRNLLAHNKPLPYEDILKLNTL